MKALNGLQRATDNELSGEAHQAASQHIKELFRLAGFDGEDTGDGGSASTPAFAEALAEVRTQAEGELSGNAFYLASKILDDLASLPSLPISSTVETTVEPVSSPVQAGEPQTSIPAEPSVAIAGAEAAPAGASFDELAAAAKARVDEVAASLGVEIVHHQASPYEYRESPLAGVELEKRSSEPCSMPEIVPLAGELESKPPVASPEAPVVAGVEEAASAREVAEATHDFGTPALEAGQVQEYAAPHQEPAPQAETLAQFKPEPEASVSAPAPEVPAKTAAAPPVALAGPEPEPAPPAPKAPPVIAVKKIDAAPKAQQKEPEKTFFSLWLDMVFGRNK